MDSKDIALSNVRLSFASLFEPNTFRGKTKFRCRFIIDKSDDKNLSIIRTARDEVAQNLQLSSKSPLIRDGAKTIYEVLEDSWIISSSTPVYHQPIVKDRLGKIISPVQALSGYDTNNSDYKHIIDGAYVNAALRIWLYEDRITAVFAKLIGVQLVSIGESLSKDDDDDAKKTEDYSSIFDNLMSTIADNVLEDVNTL